MEEVGEDGDQQQEGSEDQQHFLTHHPLLLAVSPACSNEAGTLGANCRCQVAMPCVPK